LAKYGVSVLKFFILLFIFTISLFASEQSAEKRVYASILKALFPEKTIVKVWSDKSEKGALFSKLDGVRVVAQKKDADILMIFGPEDIENCDKMIFANGYLVFRRSKGKAIGGFYWQKGRANLTFIKKNLEKEGIRLPKSLEKYVEDVE